MIEPNDIAPPSSLCRPARKDFRRIVLAREEAGNPVEMVEIDVLADYCGTRQRLRELQSLERAASNIAERLRVGRAIETAMATSRRLGRILGLQV